MRPGARLIADILLQDLLLNAPPRPLDELVQDVVREHPEWNLDPIEKAKAWTPSVEELLRSYWEESLQQGKQPRFAFNSSSSYMIQGVCFVEPRDTVDVREQKRKRLHWQDYYAVLRELDPRQFEVLCSRVLGLLGVPSPQLTPYQGDEGIDFYGRLSLGDLVGHGAIFPIFETRLVVWLVGQAKHYLHTKIATPNVRELVGAATLGRTRAFSKNDVYPDLRIRACDPVIMLFFTTGEISPYGWALCNRAGVAAMDGEMLATFLADKGIAVRTNGPAQEFHADSFVEWVATG